MHHISFRSLFISQASSKFQAVGKKSALRYPKNNISHRLNNSSLLHFSNHTKRSNMKSKINSSDNDIIDELTPRLTRQLTSTFDNVLAEDVRIISNGVSNGTLSNSESDDSAKDIISTYSSETIKNLYCLKTGEATDIGGGHVNQDKSFCCKVGENNEHLVIGVFDGHGRELGELAAVTANEFFQTELRKLDVIEDLRENPKKTFCKLFEIAHEKIKEVFKQTVEEDDEWNIYESNEGYLVKQSRHPIQTANGFYQQFEINVHGGTTATLAVILNSERLLIANVGDSTALFGGVNSKGKVLYQELSAEHSPESLSEYERVKAKCHKGKNLMENDMLTMRFIYDIIEKSNVPAPKYCCPQIFSVDHSNGVCRKTSLMGTYYKNVRSEWASLVTTPPTAKFQDALAFTRSLGDFHLHVYGVIHEPEVREYSLEALHNEATENQESNNTASVLLVCTDGVWDNWKYEDIIRYVLTSKNLKNTITESSNAQDITEDLMAANLTLAKKYFGNQADNMTSIVSIIHNEFAE